MDIKKRIATSRSTLPVASALALAVWGVAYLQNPMPLDWAGDGGWITRVGAFVLAVYLMVMLNNSYALMRIYSRTVSTTFMFLTCACGLFESLTGGFVTLCVLGFFMSSFRLYQDKHAPGWAFVSFLCLGLVSFVWVQILYLVPLLLFIMLLMMQASSWRNFSGAILGLLLPYWTLIPVILLTDTSDLLISHFREFIEQGPGILFTVTQDYIAFDTEYYLSHVKWGNTIFATILLLLFSISSLHFIHYAYEEKIKNRMLYNTLMIVTLIGYMASALMPMFFEYIIRIIIIAASPVIAHYVTFSNSKVASITTLVFTILLWISCFLYLSNMVIWDSSLLLS